MTPTPTNTRPPVNKNSLLYKFENNKRYIYNLDTDTSSLITFTGSGANFDSNKLYTYESQGVGTFNQYVYNISSFNPFTFGSIVEITTVTASTSAFPINYYYFTETQKGFQQSGDLYMWSGFTSGGTNGFVKSYTPGQVISDLIVTNTTPSKIIGVGHSDGKAAAVQFNDSTLTSLEYNILYTGLTEVNDRFETIFTYDWSDGSGDTLNVVTVGGDVYQLTTKFPYEAIFKRNILENSSSTISYASSIKNNSNNTVIFEDSIYLSGLTSEMVYVLTNNSLNLTIGDIVSGTTYQSFSGMNPKAIDKIALEVSGVPQTNYETKYKVISKSVALNNKWFGGYWTAGYTYLPNYKSDGSLLDYSFTTITDDSPETTPSFTGTLKILIDVSDSTYQLRDDDNTLISRLNVISDALEEIATYSNLSFDISCDYVIHSGDTTFDSFNLGDYRDYYINLGGIYDYTGYHIGILWGGSILSAGLADGLTGLYAQVKGDADFLVNSSVIWDTFNHELGHLLGISHTFECKWGSLFPELGTESLDNSDNSLANCLECGYRAPYLGEFTGSTLLSGYTAIMGYGRFETDSCSSFRGAERLLENSYELFRNTDADSDSICYVSTNSKDVNVTYYKFLDDGELSNGELSHIVVNFDCGIALPDSNYIIDSAQIVTKDSLNSTTIMEQRSGTTDYNVIVSGTSLMDVFDYNNQSKFGLKFSREIVQSGGNSTGWYLYNNGDTYISFHLTGGTVLTERLPKDFYSEHEGSQIKVPVTRAQRNPAFNSYEKIPLNQTVNFLRINYFNNT